MITVDGLYGKWLIMLFDKKKVSLKDCIYELLKNHSEAVEKYSVFVRSNPLLKKEWEQLPKNVKEKLNLSLLLCTKGGKVKEI